MNLRSLVRSKRQFLCVIICLFSSAILACGGSSGGSGGDGEPEDQLDRVVALESAPIVGAWRGSGNEVFVFYADGRYVGRPTSIYYEYGTYTHDNDTGALTLTLVANEGNDSGIGLNFEFYDGLSTPNYDTVFVSGDTMTIQGEANTQLSRLVADATSPIVGAWDLRGYTAVVFFSDLTYLIYDNGVEYGTYAHDNITGQLRPGNVMDFNQNYGLAESGTADEDITVYVDDDLMSLYYPDDD